MLQQISNLWTTAVLLSKRHLGNFQKVKSPFFFIVWASY